MNGLFLLLFPHSIVGFRFLKSVRNSFKKALHIILSVLSKIVINIMPVIQYVIRKCAFYSV